MAECRYFPECQRCNEVGDSWIPCTGGADGIQCGAYEPMPDVGALLALADEIEGNDVSYCVSTQYVLDSYADRIREACGERAS